MVRGTVAEQRRGDGGASGALREPRDVPLPEEGASGHALLEAVPDALVITDEAQRITCVNARTEAMFGYTRAELLGRSADLLVPSRFRHLHPLGPGGRTDAQWERPMGCAGVGLRGLRKDGSEFPVEFSLAAIRAASGRRVVTTVRDITVRRAAEERINELAQIVESSQDAILANTLDGRLTYWNAAAARLYGYGPAEAVGRHVSMIAPADRQEEIEELLLRVRRGEKLEHFETTRLTRDGRLVDVELTLWPTYAPDGHITGGCAIVRDVSDRKRAEKELTQLYEQQRHVALTLQRSLMGPPPTADGLESASRYLPATQGAGVGGDWFDLVPLGAGRYGMLIGDVMGRGLEAAAVMGQLRSAAHALAKTGMPPRQLMQALEAVVADLPDQLVTCCYLVLDPDAREVTVSSAGHLPVLLAAPGSGVTRLPVPVSVPLGVGDVPHQQVTLPVPPGAVLTLYTDGLIETPGDDIETRVSDLADVLEAALAGPRAGLGDAADRTIATLLPPAPYEDDVTLLLVRVPEGPLASACVGLDNTPSSIAAGRRFVERVLAAWECSRIGDDARLLTSEMLTNAVRHGEGPLGLRLRRTPEDITIEVADRSPRPPLPRRAGIADESGRGLFLVDVLARGWGSRQTDDGKVVWCTLPLSGARPGRPSRPGQAGPERPAGRT